MQIKPAGLDDLTALVHCINAALEHVPPVTRSMIESAATPRIKSLESILNPPDDKNQDHG